MAQSPAPVVERLLYDPTDQPMKYLWLKYVEGVNLAEHCQKCLLGPGSRRIGTRFIAGRTRPFLFEDVVLDEYAPRVYYLCGVSDPYDLRTNFHLAFTFQPGGRIHVDEPGVEITVRDARRLPITRDHIDPAHPRAGAYMWKTCRNWQFAWALKRGAYFILGPDAGPVPDEAPPIPPAPASLF